MLERHPKSRVPVVAIVLQGVFAIAIAWSGEYEEILGYCIAADWSFFALAASCLFALRRHDAGRGDGEEVFRNPGHPWTTTAFIVAALAVVANTVYRFPVNSAIGLGILAAGVPVWWLWKRQRA